MSFVIRRNPLQWNQSKCSNARNTNVSIKGDDNRTLSGYRSPIYRRTCWGITEGAAARISRCKNTEDLFLTRAFRVLDSYFVRKPVYLCLIGGSDKSPNSIRLWFRRLHGGIYLVILVARDVSICNRKYLHSRIMQFRSGAPPWFGRKKRHLSSPRFYTRASLSEIGYSR